MLGSVVLGPFVLLAGAACASVFDLFMSLLVAAVARTFVLGSFVLGALVLPAARAFGSFALASVMLGSLGLCVVAAALTFVLGILVLPAVAAVACAFVLVPSLLFTTVATAGVGPLVLGAIWLFAGAQACCFAWIGSSRGPGSHVLRPRALHRRRRALRALMPYTLLLAATAYVACEPGPLVLAWGGRVVPGLSAPLLVDMASLGRLAVTPTGGLWPDYGPLALDRGLA